MGIWQNIARKLTADPPEQKAIPSLVGGTSLDFGRVWLGGQLEIDELTRWSAYAYSVYAYAAMQYRATKISEPPLWVARETEDGEEWLDTDPLQPILDYPSPDFDMGYLRAITSMYLDMDGEALWHLVRDNGGRVARIYPYAKEQFTVMSGEVVGTGEKRLYARFRIQHSGGSVTYGPEDVVYFREPSIELTGAVTSRLDSALKWANMGERVEVAVREAFKRGVLPFAVFSHPEDYNPDTETRDANREALETKYGGAENHGRPLMLYGGLKAQFANVELANLLPSDVLDRVEANVALAFGVRAEVLGYMVGLKNSPWSHMETARRITYEDTIEPYWRREEKALSRQLLTDADRAARKFIRVDTGNIRALQDDEKMKADIARQNSDIWTVDERRIYTGKEPLGGPTGEEIRASTRPAPLTELAAEGPVERKQLERGHLEWLELDMTAKADERNWVPAVLRMLGKQRIDIERAFREFVRIEGTTVSPDSLARFLAEMSDYFAGPGLEVMRDALTPLVQSTTFSASRRLTARLGLDFNVVQEGLARFASNETAYLAKVLGQTTASRMAAIVQEGMAERATFGDIVERIVRSTAFDENRAMMIARTETTRITNGARLESARQVEHNTGQVMLKSWLSSRDDRTRDTHLEMDDGEWYPIEYEFPVGTKAPNEPNCRCQLGYMMQEEPDEVIAP